MSSLQTQILECIERGDCAAVRAFLAAHEVGADVWNTAVVSAGLGLDNEVNAKMLRALAAPTKIASITQDAALAYITNRVDCVVDQLVQCPDINEIVRRHFAFIIAVDTHIGRGVGDIQQHIAYLDQRESAVQKHSLEKHLSQTLKPSVEPTVKRL